MRNGWIRERQETVGLVLFFLFSGYSLIYHFDYLFDSIFLGF